MTRAGPQLTTKQGTCKNQTVVATAHIIIMCKSRLGLRPEPLLSRRPWLSLQDCCTHHVGTLELDDILASTIKARAKIKQLA